MTVNNLNKSQLRQWAKKIRAEISDDQRDSDEKKLKSNVTKHLVRVIQDWGTDCIDTPCNDDYVAIATYYPFGTETHPPHEIPNAQMALPVIRDKKTLEFYPWSPEMHMVKRDFDIPIPDTRGLSVIIPDIILIPLLLCDTHGNRIGYGAGQYDRYIGSLDVRPKLIGVCFDEQVYDGSIPAEPHDQKLDLIITPKRIITVA